jgi:hypothetical protein
VDTAFSSDDAQVVFCLGDENSAQTHGQLSFTKIVMGTWTQDSQAAYETDYPGDRYGYTLQMFENVNCD